ncbi:ABC transporter ATP-binding protein, partial [Streptomyces flaveolus]
DLVVRLVHEGIALRELAPVVSPLEAAFLALTEQRKSDARRQDDADVPQESDARRQDDADAPQKSDAQQQETGR